MILITFLETMPYAPLCICVHTAHAWSLLKWNPITCTLSMYTLYKNTFAYGPLELNFGDLTCSCILHLLPLGHFLINGKTFL